MKRGAESGRPVGEICLSGMVGSRSLAAVGQACNRSCGYLNSCLIILRGFVDNIQYV